jgi:hypothetical protein
MKAKGFAIAEAGEIDMATAGPTAQSAMVNWLYNKGWVVMRDCKEEQITEAFEQMKGEARLIKISIEEIPA